MNGARYEKYKLTIKNYYNDRILASLKIVIKKKKKHTYFGYT